MFLLADTPNAHLNNEHKGHKFLVSSVPVDEGRCAKWVDVCKSQGEGYGYGADWIGVSEQITQHATGRGGYDASKQASLTESKQALLLVDVEVGKLSEFQRDEIAAKLRRHLREIDRIAMNELEPRNADGLIVRVDKLQTWLEEIRPMVPGTAPKIPPIRPRSSRKWLGHGIVALAVAVAVAVLLNDKTTDTKQTDTKPGSKENDKPKQKTDAEIYTEIQTAIDTAREEKYNLHPEELWSKRREGLNNKNEEIYAYAKEWMKHHRGQAKTPQALVEFLNDKLKWFFEEPSGDYKTLVDSKHKEAVEIINEVLKELYKSGYGQLANNSTQKTWDVNREEWMPLLDKLNWTKKVEEIKTTREHLNHLRKFTECKWGTTDYDKEKEKLIEPKEF
ncbi:hypothetical protein FRUB_08396 [Fimbriiglobus ruber]|uniref:Uncharacterized protein n=1 Tax=Fimbriiglobus ruber TaxID=1908690 RepID=A0A225D4H2_9BACT|nr:hypothetical protein FRUB_08396 [Fimbriiglobus ruber]